MEGSKLRARAFATLRLVASVLILAVLVPRVHLGAVLRLHTLGWLAAAIAVTFAGVVLSALRWQRVLAALALRAPVPTLLSHYLASLFVGNVLPSTVGGDVLRVTRLAAANGDTPGTFASVVIERLTGWVVLPVLTLAAVIANPGLRRDAPQAVGLCVLIAVSTLTGLLLLLVGVAHPRLGGRLTASDGWRRFTGAVHLGLDRFRRRPGLALEVLTAGFAYQLAVMLAAFFAAKALGIDVGWTAILAFFPVVAIIQVIPVTIGGLGTREGALVLLLGSLDVASADAIALGLLFYGVNLVVSLLGAPAFALARRPARVLA
ncbi:MAG: glycosyltransferase 2 family protein [Actinomycetota bacterium]